MFNKGDKIVYGQTGVCIVEDICEKALTRNNKKMYYTLKPIYQHNNVIYTPVDNDKVFMRPVISKGEAEKLIELIPGIQNKVESEDEPQTGTDSYRETLESHSSSDLAELVIQIYSKKQTAHKMKKKLGFIDEKNIKRAEDMLFGELAIALDMPVEDVPKMLVNVIKGN